MILKLFCSCSFALSLLNSFILILIFFSAIALNVNDWFIASSTRHKLDNNCWPSSTSHLYYISQFFWKPTLIYILDNHKWVCQAFYSKVDELYPYTYRSIDMAKYMNYFLYHYYFWLGTYWPVTFIDLAHTSINVMIRFCKCKRVQLNKLIELRPKILMNLIRFTNSSIHGYWSPL